jgi:thiamine-monophosphate kinase
VADELDFLKWIHARARGGDLVRLGSGDDLAVLAWPAGDLLLAGVDQVLDGVHFDSKIHSPRQIGRKAMNRNLSDCAAMACLPAAALATVALPKGVGMEYARELYLGMEEAAAVFDCPIVGGDTGSWDGKLAVTVTIFGRSGGIEPITRAGAKAGDFIFVTGPLGGSILGRHMTFEPRVKLARELAGQSPPSSMIDISDGLARDLRNICRQSNVGADIDANAIPIHADARKMENPIARALCDGEDYELLLTSRTERPGLHRVGVITADQGIFLRVGTELKPLEEQGWQHTF